MVIIYTKIFHSNALQNLPNLEFLVSKQTIRQPRCKLFWYCSRSASLPQRAIAVWSRYVSTYVHTWWYRLRLRRMNVCMYLYGSEIESRQGMVHLGWKLKLRVIWSLCISIWVGTIVFWFCSMSISYQDLNHLCSD
jgi:hypothetical protein